MSSVEPISKSLIPSSRACRTASSSSTHHAAAASSPSMRRRYSAIRSSGRLAQALGLGLSSQQRHTLGLHLGLPAIQGEKAHSQDPQRQPLSQSISSSLHRPPNLSPTWTPACGPRWTARCYARQDRWRVSESAHPQVGPAGPSDPHSRRRTHCFAGESLSRTPLADRGGDLVNQHRYDHHNHDGYERDSAGCQDRQPIP